MSHPPAGGCVCVDHLKRCKTSNLLDDVLQWFSNLTLPFWLFHLIFQQKQGVVAGSRVYHQRRRSGFPGDTWPDQPCVPANFSEMGRGSTQEPPCRSFELFIFLHCCRNLEFLLIKFVWFGYFRTFLRART